MLKLTEVAERLGCSLSNVYSLKDQGLLAVVLTGAGGKGYRVAPVSDSFAIAVNTVARTLLRFPKSSDPCPKNAIRRFENLDGERLFLAWRKQGVLVDLPNERNARDIRVVVWPIKVETVFRSTPCTIPRVPNACLVP